MGRPPIAPKIEALLLPYLEQKAREYNALKHAASEDGDVPKPTLPSTRDGKIDITNVARAIGLTATQRQHLYKGQIVALIDDAAALQGLAGVGSRSDEPADDRVERLQSKLSDCMRELAESEANVARLRRENDGLRRQLTLLTETGTTIRTEAL